MLNDDMQQVLFKVSRPESGHVWHATAATIEEAQRFLRLSWEFMSEAGFVIEPILPGEKAKEIDYRVLVLAAVKLSFHKCTD